MKLIIDCNGKRYESVGSKEVTVQEAVEALRESISDVRVFSMDLKDGGMLYLARKLFKILPYK